MPWWCSKPALLFVGAVIVVVAVLPQLADGGNNDWAPTASTLAGVSLDAPALPEANRWAQEAAVPTAPVELRVIYRRGCAGLPSAEAVGCFYGKLITIDPTVIGKTVSMQSGPPPVVEARWVLMHELGHVFDHYVMTPRDRASFERMLGTSRGWWQGRNAPGEQFAQAYQTCALLPPLTAKLDEVAYGYDPSPEQSARVCRLIRMIGARSAS